MSARIIFAGTPDFAAVHLQALLDAGIKPVAVYTQPDRPSGRGHKLTPSPVKVLSQRHGLPVYTPDNFRNEEDLAQFESLKADLAIVVAYGVILPQRIIDAPLHGCINVHGSLLPKYRGAAPIQRALFDGEKNTGVTIMRIVKELDAGAMLKTAELPIGATDTSESLFEKLAKLGARTLTECLDDILHDNLADIPQDPALVTYAAKIDKSEAPLDFSKAAAKLDLQVRALNPWPIATATLNGVRYKIFVAEPVDDGAHEDYGTISKVDKLGFEVRCAQGSLRIIRLQAPGKGPVNAADLARSLPQIFYTGNRFD